MQMAETATPTQPTLSKYSQRYHAANKQQRNEANRDRMRHKRDQERKQFLCDFVSNVDWYIQVPALRRAGRTEPELSEGADQAHRVVQGVAPGQTGKVQGARRRVWPRSPMSLEEPLST